MTGELRNRVTPATLRFVRPLAVAVTAWIALQAIIPGTTPLGVVALGLVFGSLNAMLAVGLVLVYRSNRIVNFSHGETGQIAAILAVELAALGLPYLLALAIALVVGGIVGGIVEVLFVRRFRDAPRLLLTVATIAIAQVLAFSALLLPRAFGEDVIASQFTTPLSSWRFEITPIVFDGNYLLVIAVTIAAVVSLSLALTRTSWGVGIRAAAENVERAALAGIPTKMLSTSVWIVAGVLSATAGVLRAPVVGLSVGAAVGPSLLLKALAAAVLGRMTSLPVTISAAMALGIVEQAIYWSYGRSQVVDAILVLVILVALLLRRRADTGRVDDDQASSWRMAADFRALAPELRRLPKVRGARLVAAVTALVAVLALPLPLPVNAQTLLSAMVIWSVVGVSLVVLTGWAGQVSLGHFAIVGIGAAVAGNLQQSGADLFVGMVAAALAGIVAALVLGIPALRLRGLNLAVTTLAFAVATSSWLLLQDWFLPRGVVDRPLLFQRIDLENEVVFYWFCLGLLALVLGAGARLRRSRIGRAIIAVRNNDRAAQAYGINVVVAKLTAFALSGAVAGLAGSLFLNLQHGVVLNQYDPTQSLQAFTMVVVGGVGSLSGGVLGAVFVRGAQLLPDPFPLFASGLGLLMVLLVLPQGLVSVVERVRNNLTRRLVGSEQFDSEGRRSAVGDQRSAAEVAA